VIRVRVCPDADGDSSRSRRAYAHTYCGSWPGICVASSFFALSREHRDGILAHEIGHLLAGPDGDEWEADAAFLESTGVRIEYADGAHGRCLQWVDPKDSGALYGTFEFEFSGRASEEDVRAKDDGAEYILSGGDRLRSMADAVMRASQTGEDVWAEEGGRRLGWMPPAFGGSAGIMLFREDEVLLLLRSGAVSEPGTWGIPGGLWEPGETPIETAHREASEETGGLPTHEVTGEFVLRDDPGRPYTIFVAWVDPEASLGWSARLDREHEDWGWFRADRPPEPLHPGVELALEELGF